MPLISIPAQTVQHTAPRALRFTVFVKPAKTTLLLLLQTRVRALTRHTPLIQQLEHVRHVIHGLANATPAIRLVLALPVQTGGQCLAILACATTTLEQPAAPNILTVLVFAELVHLIVQVASAMETG